jgi:hypothetical protein
MWKFLASIIEAKMKGKVGWTFIKSEDATNQGGCNQKVSIRRMHEAMFLGKSTH